jgi:type 1 glutamine amidotransferase
MDGGARHPALAGNRLEVVRKIAARGGGIGFLHYSLEVPKERGGPELLQWVGGFYERPYSQNPVTEVNLVQASPRHPISRGWKSFSAKDEWYYRIRFESGGGRIIPLLQAGLPKDAPQQETVAWAFERRGGGRGFGSTGGHFHSNWGMSDYRQVVVNAVLWIAKAGIPRAGARCEITAEELAQNLDPGKVTLEELRRKRK